MAKIPDRLADYNAKRDFKVTAEPRGQIGSGAGQSFVVQKHDATRLHYDFRLEWEGVLLSWSVMRRAGVMIGETAISMGEISRSL